MTDHLQIAIPLFPKFTALDAVGPYEVLQRIPDFEVVFVGHARGEVRSENGMIGLSVDATFDDVVEPEPGGLVDELGLGQFTAVAGTAGTQEPALPEGALLVRQLEVLAQMPRERDGELTEAHRVAVLAGEFEAGPEIGA